MIRTRVISITGIITVFAVKEIVWATTVFRIKVPNRQLRRTDFRGTRRDKCATLPDSNVP